MDDAKAMDFVITWLLLNHEGHYFLPSVMRDAFVKGEVEQKQAGLEQLGPEFLEGLAFLGVGIQWVRSIVGLVMAKVHTGWGGGGRFAPGGNLVFELLWGDFAGNGWFG